MSNKKNKSKKKQININSINTKKRSSNSKKRSSNSKKISSNFDSNKKQKLNKENNNNMKNNNDPEYKKTIDEISLLFILNF